VRARTAAIVALSTMLACFHARHVQKAQSPESNEEGAGSSSKKEMGSSPVATPNRIPPHDGRPAVAGSPEGVMNPGSSKQIQEALRKKGYLKEDDSGHLDQATSAALRKFQGENGLPETGAPDRETLRKLGVNPQTVYRTVPEGEEAIPKK